MWLLFFTPKRARTLIITQVAWYVLAPVVIAYYYYVELRQGAFPTNADSIGIPIWNFAIGWFIASPVTALVLWMACRNYVGSVSLWEINKQRPVWSVLWTAACVAAIVVYLTSAYDLLVNDPSYPLLSLYWLLGAWMALHIRTAIISKPATTLENFPASMVKH